jgi:hypothetical protein
MSKFTKTYRWASGACLAIAAVATIAIAQEQQYQSRQDQQRAQQDEQRAQQDQQQAEQDRQRAQQDQQQAEQERQRSQQSGQSRQRPWDQSRMQDRGTRFPQPSRDTYGRGRDDDSREHNQYGRDEQWQNEQRYGRDEQSSQRDEQSGREGNEAGLGVTVARDGQGAGVLVVRVHRGSPAQEMGLQEGDRITHLNGRQVQSSGQFISQIRNMEPGEEVELDVERDSGERTFRGELESRREALVLRGRPLMRGLRGDTWQTGYEEGRSYSQGQSGRSGDVDRQISQIERQIDQMSREIDQLRNSVRDIRDQSGRWGRETTARYDEYRDTSRDRPRVTGRWQDDQRQFDGSQGYYQEESQRRFGGERSFDERRQPRRYQEGTRSRDSSQDQSPGGETGEERTRTGSEIHDRN